jgi:hypothetical protein
VSAYDDSTEDNLITHIKHGRRPSRPTDPRRNQWLQDRVWDTITTCWSNKPYHRCGLSVVHHIFSTPSPPDLLLEFPPVGRKNLIRLAEELLYTFLVLPLNPGQRARLRIAQECIYNVISRDEASPTSLSSVEVAALVEIFEKVSFSPPNSPPVSEAPGG